MHCKQSTLNIAEECKDCRPLRLCRHSAFRTIHVCIPASAFPGDVFNQHAGPGALRNTSCMQPLPKRSVYTALHPQMPLQQQEQVPRIAGPVMGKHL